MSINFLSEGIGKVWCRLFDHRAFLNGEINLLLREFEQKKGEKEVDDLFTLVENITDIKCTQVDRLKLAIEHNIPDSLSDIEKALSSYEKCLLLEYDVSKDEILKKNRKTQKADWDHFMLKITSEYSEIDSAFENEEQKIREQYNKLEKQLYSVPL